jgi:hypothetical protein
MSFSGTDLIWVARRETSGCKDEQTASERRSPEIFLLGNVYFKKNRNLYPSIEDFEIRFKTKE